MTFLKLKNEQIFTEQEILVLEYAKDISSYYECGHSHDLNKVVHGLSVRDMMLTLSSEKDPKVTAYFTHSSSLLLHLTAMGAYEGDHEFTADNFFKLTHRKWSSSKLIPMAANFVAIRYKNEKVRFFMNEELVQLPQCPNGVCELAKLKVKYAKFLE